LPQLADREVDEDVLATLLGAARVAPSADNLQPCRTISVRSPDTRRELARAVPGPLAESVEAAPVVLVACGVRAVLTRARREQPFVLMDVPIAVTHILLQAEELSLACAWTLELDEEMVRRALGIPEDVRVLALLCLGWPGRPRAI
jgi:nitroreductase